MTDQVPRPFTFTASMPDVRTKPADLTSNVGTHFFAAHSDVSSLGGIGMIHYEHVISIFRNEDQAFIGFITLERSPYSSDVLCEFNGESHLNYGQLPEGDTAKAFFSKAEDMLRKRFGVQSIHWEQPRRMETKKRTLWQRFRGRFGWQQQ